MELGWVDFSREDRNKTLEIIRLLSQDTLDELGIGLVRDSISETLFPGTSTIHTRTKYFFIVPSILQKLKEDIYNKKIKSYQSAMEQLERIERAVTEELCKNNPDAQGIIGISTVTGQSVSWIKRGPTEIYWSSLKKYGFLVDKNITLSSYIKHSIKSHNNYLERQFSKREEDDFDAGNYREIQLWDNELFKDNKLALNSKSMELNKDQALYLKRKIITAYPNSLLSVILQNPQRMKKFTKVNKLNMLYDFVKDNDLSNKNEFQKQIKLARDFSSFTYVLIIIYNIIISSGKNGKDELKDKNLKEAAKLDIYAVFDEFSIKKERLKRFLKEAQEAMKNNDIDSLKKIISEREKSIKGEARAKTSSPDKNRTWQGGGELDYRFAKAQVMVEDIYNALYGVLNVRSSKK